MKKEKGVPFYETSCTCTYVTSDVSASGSFDKLLTLLCQLYRAAITIGVARLSILYRLLTKQEI